MTLADERTLDVLDFARIGEMVARETASDRAHDRARALAGFPTREAARDAVVATTEMRRLIAQERLTLARVATVDAAVAGAARGVTIGGEDLRLVAIALGACAALVRAITATEAPALTALARPFVALPHLIAAIDQAIGERGEMLDRASPALSRIRRGIAQAQEEARERATAIVRSARYARAFQDAIVTMRNGRYVVPVKADFSGEVPGIVHDASSSGQTLFVEPLEALETNNRLRSLRSQEEHEIARILAELSAVIGVQAPPIERNIEVYAQLDLAHARARVAEHMNAVAPVLDDGAVLAVQDGRHPLLGERAIPQSLALDERTRMIVISGPNMGGKTVALKMVGLFVLMTACGMHVPAGEETVIGDFDSIFTDIGDEQSIAQNASTFSAHLRRIGEIVDRAGSRSLVLIDEIGSGTEPQAGAALAIAVLERLLTSGARGIVTTHASELKLFGGQHPGVQNASVRFDPDTYTPTYQLDIGAPGRSLAFPLARRVGLDEAVIARAETVLSSQERDYERALAEVADVRAQLQAERAALARERTAVIASEADAKRRADALERERTEFARTADERFAQRLREFATELERRYGERGRPRVTSGQSALLARTLGELHHELGLDRKPVRRPQARGVGVGDRVSVPSFGSEGTVVEDHGDQIVVLIGSMRTTVRKDEVEERRGGGVPVRQRTSVAGPKLEAASSASIQLDVRGKRYVEAEPIVEAWIDESMLAGASPLRLIHGKGTGLLGRGLQHFLKSHAHVSGVRYGNEDEGGGGVTVFELR